LQKNIPPFSDNKCLPGTAIQGHDILQVQYVSITVAAVQQVRFVFADWCVGQVVKIAFVNYILYFLS
jgi:ribosomal protein L4